jgi:CHRD domain
MRKRWWAVIAAAALAVTAGAVAATDLNFGTHLKGQFEVPLRDTDAQGQATFRVADDGQSVDYKLIASNIDNAFMAHIHMTPPGVDPLTNNGGIVVWLYPSTAPVPGPLGGGRHDGVLAEGTITAADLVGALAGHPLSDLLAAIADGRAYVNVHTNDGVDGINTGPGDFPGGEIRGQLGN